MRELSLTDRQVRTLCDLLRMAMHECARKADNDQQFGYGFGFQRREAIDLLETINPKFNRVPY
jgi:hypothetical protein